MNPTIRHNPTTNTIDILNDGMHIYWIDLAWSTKAHETLDWIIQISKKEWATNELIGQLVKTLDATLNLQNTQCGERNQP